MFVCVCVCMCVRVRVCVCVRARARARIRHVVNCALSLSTVFFHIFLQTAQFSKQVTGHKMCVLIFCTICVKQFSIYEELRGI